MSEEIESEKWAANIAFTGPKEVVKDIIKYIGEQEENSQLGDVTLIEGPYGNLREMLKDRKNNLALGEQDRIRPQIPAPESIEYDQKEKHDEDEWEHDEDEWEHDEDEWEHDEDEEDE